MKKILIFPIVLILLCAFGLTITTQFNASDSSHNCTPNYDLGGGWIDNQNATDNNFNTLAYAQSDKKVYCNWLFPKIVGYESAVLISRSASSSDPVHYDTLPAECFRDSRFNMTLMVWYNTSNPNHNTTFLYCEDTTGALKLIRSTGYGECASGCKNFYELAINATYTGVSACPGKPSSPIFAQDDFSYYDPITSCGWYLTPSFVSISPTNGQMCYSGTEDFKYYLPHEGNYYAAPVFSESFDLTLSNASFFEHTFEYVNDDGLPRPALTLDFFPNAGGSIQYYAMINGTTSVKSLCSNCFNPEAKTTFKIIIYNSDASGYTTFNTSANTFQAVQPDTFSLQINGGAPYFNLPILNVGELTIPLNALFSIYGGNMCLDNYLLYSGVNSASVVITGQPTQQLGEKCGKDIDCFTGYCNYLKICDKKGFMAACVNGYECLSGKCAGGYCTKPTAWMVVDKLKTDALGSDTNTDNMTAILLSLVFAIIIAVVLASIGAGGLIAGGIGGIILLISLFFFTMVGWLSAWILIAVVIVIILLIVFMIVVGLNRGGV